MFLDRVETIKTRKRLEIPTAMLAAAAGVATPRIAEFENHKPLTTEKTERNKDAIRKKMNISPAHRSVSAQRI